MKTMHAGWVGFALLAVAGPVALTHCSGASDTTSPDGGSASSGSGGSGTTGGSGSSSGASSSDSDASLGGGSGSSSTTPGGDGGDTAEGGASSGSAAAPAVDGGPIPSDPGMLQCGSMTCNTSEKSCCHRTGDAGVDECIGPNGSCSNGTTLRCDEASDCETGLVCCGTFGSTSCASACGGPSYQVCRTDGECGTNVDAGAAKKCILQTCGGTPVGNGPPSPVVTIQACAVESVPVTRGGPGGPGGPGPVRFDAAVEPPTWGALAGCKAK
jgi:hypothetical protein